MSFRKHKNVAREVCTGEVSIQVWKMLLQLLQLSGSAGKKLTDNEKTRARETGRGSKTKTGLRQREQGVKGKNKGKNSLDTPFILIRICGLTEVSHSINTTCASSNVCSVGTRERSKFHK